MNNFEMFEKAFSDIEFFTTTEEFDRMMKEEFEEMEFEEQEEILYFN